MGEELDGQFNKNDKVLVYPWVGDGVCRACIGGDENLCDNPRSLGIYNDGAYA
jgi:alcohol dehydrogenase, propanol-preferring